MFSHAAKVEHSGTPYFCFKDIDENKPTGSIRIRTETIGYFLKRYREDMVANKKKKSAIEVQLKEFEDRLRRQMLKECLASIEQQQEHPGGALPRIDVTIGHLAASRPPAPVHHATGD